VGLLDDPRHLVEVQLRDATPGSLGQSKLVEYGDRIPTRCNFQPLDSAEILNRGLQLEVTGRISCRSWPGDSRSLVYYDGWEWEPVGEPEHFRMSERTDHFVVIVKRGARDGTDL
jgi:hypothetical protein